MWLVCLVGGLVSGFGSKLQADEFPDVQEVLEAVRWSATSQPVTLNGRLRDGRERIPFSIEVKPGVVHYRFQDRPGALRFRFAENTSFLEEIDGQGQARPADPEKMVAGTSLDQGDLALRFLYWPNAVIEREETVRTRKCWLIRLRAPAQGERYAVVFVWIDQSSGALMRMDGHDWEGTLVRRFEVISGQRIQGRWVLKQMRVQGYQSGRVSGRAYLEISDGAFPET